MQIVSHERIAMSTEEKTRLEMFGEDYISPDAASNATGIDFSSYKKPGELFANTTRFPTSPFEKFAGDYVLLPGPPHDMNMHEVSGLFADVPVVVNGESFAFDGEIVPATSWFFIKKEPLPISCNLSLHEISKIDNDRVFLPNASLLIYAMLLHFHVTSKPLFGGCLLTTSTLVHGSGYNLPLCVGTKTCTTEQRTNNPTANVSIVCKSSWMSEIPKKKGFAVAKRL